MESGGIPRRALALTGVVVLAYFGLMLLLVCLWLASNLRRAGPGRMLIAVRDNDAAARSAGT